MRRPGQLAPPLLLLLLAASAGCARTLEARGRQPLPVTPGGESAPLYIYVRDPHLPASFRLQNAAQFQALAADRARFRLRFVHGFAALADPGGWSLELVDDAGRHLRPAAASGARVERVTVRWSPGGWVPTLGGEPGDGDDSWDVYQGEITVDFAAAELLSPGRRSLTLIARRDGVELRYVWRFADGPAVAEHHRAPKPGCRRAVAIAVVTPGE